MRAASSYSRGMVMKNWRSRKMKKAPPPNQAGTIRGFSVFSQPKVAEDQILWDEDNMIRDHQCGENKHEQDIAPGKAQTGETVGGQAGGQQAAHQHAHDDGQRVEPGNDEGKLDKRVRVVDSTQTSAG